MNPRRSNRPFRSNRPAGGRSGGFSGGQSGARMGGRRGGGRGGPKPPMLLGEPSPSLAKINTMNMAKLEAKIASLNEEQQRMTTRLEKLKAVDPPPADKIASLTDLLARLEALKDAAQTRLEGKQQRKAAREQGR